MMIKLKQTNNTSRDMEFDDIVSICEKTTTEGSLISMNSKTEQKP